MLPAASLCVCVCVCVCVFVCVISYRHDTKHISLLLCPQAGRSETEHSIQKYQDPSPPRLASTTHDTQHTTCLQM